MEATEVAFLDAFVMQMVQRGKLEVCNVCIDHILTSYIRLGTHVFISVREVIL